jgi:carboxymethylenebutenolidase
MTEQKLLSDVVGLSKVMPPLSRRGFMTSSAAAAAGYTLAAGPVRADVVRTDTNGLISGGAQVMVPGGNMPVYYARPATRRTHLSSSSPWKFSDCTNTSRTSRAG